MIHFWYFSAIVFQVDKTYHDPVGKPDSEQHLMQATQILIDFIQAAKKDKRFSGWTQEQYFKGTVDYSETQKINQCENSVKLPLL